MLINFGGINGFTLICMTRSLSNAFHYRMVMNLSHDNVMKIVRNSRAASEEARLKCLQCINLLLKNMPKRLLAKPPPPKWPPLT